MRKKEFKDYPLILSNTPPELTKLRLEFLAHIEKGQENLEIEWNPLEMKEVPNLNEFHVRLVIQGFKSIEHWARVKGFKSHQVKNALRRWRSREDGFPNGECLKILIELSKTVCCPVSPVLAPFHPNYGVKVRNVKN